MREIKFKAKRLSDGEWIEGSFIYPNEIMPNPSTCEDIDIGIPIIINHSTLCQFTGLADKNGKEIYEGDIIRRCNDLIIGDDNITLLKDGKSKYVTDVFVEYVDGTFRLNKIGNDSKSYYGALNYTSQCYNHEIEVIGNIHNK